MNDRFKKFKDSTGNFKYAIEGIVHVYRSQKHMRFHMLALIICGIFSLILKLNYIEVLFVVFSITMVIVTEMINTAVEAVVDLVTQSYHPLAKFAKDIAAGATLIAALNALIVIVVIVLNHDKINNLTEAIRIDKSHQIAIILTIAFFIMISIIVMYKVAGNKGKIWKGGVISVHSAVGFFLAWATLYLDNKYAILLITLSLAGLIAQSRVEGGIHTFSEVIWGFIVATFISLLFYLIFRPLLP